LGLFLEKRICTQEFVSFCDDFESFQAFKNDNSALAYIAITFCLKNWKLLRKL